MYDLFVLTRILLCNHVTWQSWRPYLISRQTDSFMTIGTLLSLFKSMHNDAFNSSITRFPSAYLVTFIDALYMVQNETKKSAVSCFHVFDSAYPRQDDKNVQIDIIQCVPFHNQLIQSQIDIILTSYVSIRRQIDVRLTSDRRKSHWYIMINAYRNIIVNKLCL